MAPEHEATRVLAIRHGETDWNTTGRIQGQLDIGLNQVGRWQARCLTAALADENISAIYASDLARAIETAQGVVEASGCPITTDPGLRERAFGSFEGLSYAQIEAQWPEAAQRWRRRDPDFGAPGGETLAAFYARSVATARRLAALHPGQTIVLVSHGGVMDCLYRSATHVALDAPRSWQLGNAAINRLLHTPQGFSLIGWSDTHHLERDHTSPDDVVEADLARPSPR